MDLKVWWEFIWGSLFIYLNEFHLQTCDAAVSYWSCCSYLQACLSVYWGSVCSQQLPFFVKTKTNQSSGLSEQQNSGSSFSCSYIRKISEAAQHASHLTPHTVNRLITVNCADEERPDADWPVALMHCLLSGVAEKTYIIKHGRDDLPILRVLPRLHGHIFLSGVLLIFSPKHLHPNIRNKEKAAVWCRDRWDVWGWQENTHLFQISRTAPLAAENSRMNIFRSLLMISRVITFSGTSLWLYVWSQACLSLKVIWLH